MKPFLRPTDRGKLAPVGWVSEPAGRWAGREVDVVYDPRRHDVAFVRHGVGYDVRDGFREVGYRRVAVDGEGREGLAAGAGFGGGLLIGKRYVDASGALELLCTKAGTSSLSVGDEGMDLKDAKPLPSSD